MTLSEGMKKQDRTFPNLLVNMVEAGEVSGNLDIIMERMAIHFEKENKIENKVKKCSGLSCGTKYSCNSSCGFLIDCSDAYIYRHV